MATHPHATCPASLRDERLVAADCTSTHAVWGHRPGCWTPLPLTATTHALTDTHRGLLQRQAPSCVRESPDR